jgi:hypothetical protein
MEAFFSLTLEGDLTGFPVTTVLCQSRDDLQRRVDALIQRFPLSSIRREHGAECECGAIRSRHVLLSIVQIRP